MSTLLRECELRVCDRYVSSALFGTVVAGIVDKIGRKRGCVLFAVLYSLHALMHLGTEFWQFLLARIIRPTQPPSHVPLPLTSPCVCSGVATTLLFCSFEAWMVSEHKRHFEPSLISYTFAWVSLGNSGSAVVAGLLADQLAGAFGALGPMMGTLPFLGAALLIVLTWPENYGNAECSAMRTLMRGAAAIRASPHVLLLGLMQMLFEGSMHAFVFLWTPVLQSVSGAEKRDLPCGQLFSCYMASLAVGSSAYRMLLGGGEGGGQGAGGVVFLLAGVAFSAAFMAKEFESAVLAFVVFEVCCGLYFPMISTLRSEHIPEESRGAVMSLFRLPVNVVVIVVLTGSSSWPSQLAFGILAVCQFAAAVCYFVFQQLPTVKSAHVKKAVKESKKSQ